MVDLANVAQASKMRREAQRLQHIGKYADAVQLQVALINQQGGYAAERAEDMHLLGLYLFQLGDIEAAGIVLQQVFDFLPNDINVAKNLAICELKQNRRSNALKLLQGAAEASPGNYEVQDVLAHAAGLSGDLSLARKHGTISLSLKHQKVTANTQQNLSTQTNQSSPAPKFDYSNSQRNIISFSLWGTSAKYLDGAIQNARLAQDIYPAWRCRFYVDNSVPMAVIRKLRRFDAQIVEMPISNHIFDGLFWRFLVADDPDVERFIVRDCDALLNIRERAAVDLWCDSNACFHAMRDFYTHTELILAGMWGGVTNVLPNMSELIAAFKARLQLRTRIMDQIFLREEIWPLVHRNILIHDSQFEQSGTQNFPEFASLPLHAHVGQDCSIFS